MPPGTLQVPPCGRIPQGTLSRRVLLSPLHRGHGTEPRAAVARKPGLCWRARARPWELGRAARSSGLSPGDPAAASPSRVTLKRCGRGQPCQPPSWVSPLGQSPIWPRSLQHPPRTYVHIPAPRTRQLGLHRCKQGRDLEMRSAWIWAVPCAPGHTCLQDTQETHRRRGGPVRTKAGVEEHGHEQRLEEAGRTPAAWSLHKECGPATP